MITSCMYINCTEFKVLRLQRLLLHFLNRFDFTVRVHISSFLSISIHYFCPISIYKHHLYPNLFQYISYQIRPQGFIPTPESIFSMHHLSFNPNSYVSLHPLFFIFLSFLGHP